MYIEEENELIVQQLENESELNYQAKELEKEITEQYQSLIDHGFDIIVRPATKMYEFAPEFYENTVPLINIPDINGFHTLFKGLTIATGMPVFAYTQQGNQTCWNSKWGGPSIADKSKGKLVCRACGDASNTGNYVSAEGISGMLHWSYPSSVQKPQLTAILLTYLLEIEYGYEFNVGQKSNMIFEASVEASVLESNMDGSGKKVVANSFLYGRNRENYSTDKNSPGNGSFNRSTPKHKVEALKFTMQPNKKYEVYVNIYNYASAWHGKAAAKIGYQHIPFA